MEELFAIPNSLRDLIAKHNAGKITIKHLPSNVTALPRTRLLAIKSGKELIIPLCVDDLDNNEPKQS